MKKTQPLLTLGMLASLTSAFLGLTPAQAADLLETYQLALKNDANWAARKARYLAEREIVDQAWATLLPVAGLTASMASAETTAPSFITDQSRQQCLEAINQNQQSEDPTDLLDCSSLIEDLLTVGGASETTTRTAQRFGLSVNQPLFYMDRWFGYKRAQRIESAAQADLAYQQQELMVRVAEAYFGVLRAEEELRLAKAEQASLQTQLSEIKNRYQLGLVRDTDLFEVQATYDLASAAVLVTESVLDNLKEDLRLLTRQPTVLVNPLPPNIPVEPPQPASAEDWEEYAKRNNYQVIAARFSVDASQHQVKQTRYQHAPTLDLFLDYSKSELSGDVPGTTTQTIGVNFALPLYAGGGIASRERQARFKADEADQQLEFAERNAVRESRQFHRRVMTDVATVQANERAVRSNNSAYRSIKSGYESGIRSLTDLLSAQSKVFTARKDLAVSRYDYIINTLKLKRAAGTLSPNDLEVLNSWLDEPGKNVGQLAREQEVLTLEEIDGVKLRRERTATSFEAEQKEERSSHKSLFEAFKAWQRDE
jgi:outer membrane protein